MRAKEYAKLQDSSLSFLIENYLKSLTGRSVRKSNIDSTPIVNSLRGSFKSPKRFDYKSELYEALRKKHL